MRGLQIFEGAEGITVLFGKIPFNHCLYFDVENDHVYFDGVRVKTTKLEFNYTKDLMFQKNKQFQKKRVLTFPKSDGKSPFVLALDVGFDGRLFAKFFYPKVYRTMRGKPEKVLSYWHDRQAKEKKFYEDDLSRPKRVWKCKYKKDVLA